MTEWYVVVHESHLTNSTGLDRTDYGIASSLHDTYAGAENQLAYCQAMQGRDFPGSGGRYFIAMATALTTTEESA